MKAVLEKSYINYILAILSGLLLALAFPYPSIAVFAWIGLVPLLFAVRRSSLKQAPVLGLAFGVTFFLTVLYWIQIFGFMAWVALGTMLSIWTTLFALGAKLIFRNFSPGAQLALIPSVWALTEYGRAEWPWGFAWANLGLAAVDQKISWIASYVGEVGLSAVIVLANLALLYVAELAVARRGSVADASVRERLGGNVGAPASRSKLPYGVSAVIVALLAAEIAMPVVRSLEPPYTTPNSLNVALIQPNIPQSVKLDVTNNDEIKDRYHQMTLEAIKAFPMGPNLIIWPESVFISFIDDENDFIEEVGKPLKSTGVSLVFGGLQRDKKTKAVYNAAIYNNYKGERAGVYRKIHLVPFGEYMPMRGLVERVNDMATLVDDKTPGKEVKVFNFYKYQVNKYVSVRRRAAQDFSSDAVNAGRFSTIICFESADSNLVGKMVRKGARMLLVLTNDGWFGNTAALKQHFDITRMRAIEYGIPVVQAANTGISGFIDKEGRVTKQTGQNTKEIIASQVAFAPHSSTPSFYASFGYFLPYLYVLLLLSAALIKRFRDAQRLKVRKEI